MISAAAAAPASHSLCAMAVRADATTPFNARMASVVPRFRFRAPDVVEVLERVCGETGYPASIRVDQGSEFISKELDLWAYMKGVTLDFSRPGKPTDNAFIESFTGKFRAECLNQHWFMSLDDGAKMRGLA